MTDTKNLYLDLATITGYCEGTPELYDAGTIDLGDKRLLCHRMHNLFNWLQQYRNCRIVVEKCYSRGKNDAPILYALHGMLKYFCFLNDMHQPIEIEPSALKKFVAGKGNASKQMVLEALYQKYGIVEHDNNKGDAIALMLYDCKRKKLR